MDPIEAINMRSRIGTVAHQVNRQAGLLWDDGKIKSELANRVISFLGMCSEFDTVTADKTGAHHERFREFKQGKVHVCMGIQSMVAPFLVVERGAWGLETKHEDHDLAKQLHEFLRGCLTVKQMYYGLIRLLASDVQLRYFAEMEKAAKPDEDVQRAFASPPVEPPSDSVFGSHNSASLSDIPF